MTHVISAVLTAVGWGTGLFVLLVMAALPLLQRLGTRRNET